MLAEDRVRLRHMVEAAECAGQFMTGRQRTDLDEDRMLLFALVHAIEILGEAASKISEETRATHTGIRGEPSSACVTGSCTRTSRSIPPSFGKQ